MSHNYSDIYDSMDTEMLQDMDDTITKLELWDWMKNYEPEDGKGFMFSNHENLDKIRETMKYGGHSGSSYGWTMRVMEKVAKQGWANFRYEQLAAKQFKLTDEYRLLNRIMHKCGESSEQMTYVENLINEKIKNLAKKLKSSACPCYKEKGLIGWCGVAGGGVPGCEH